MRICLIGKFPPIQGGVSMRSYWIAHSLAARGHEVHVVTNAKEVRPPFHMHMRAADWARCEADYGAGRVSVHWTDPVDRSQHYIPLASAFVSKLVGLAARVHADRPFDVVSSYYMEPYGIAGHLAAEIAGVPHVVRMAGSDAGRLWHHPQFEALYDHVLRSAEIVLATGTVAERAVARGVDAARIASAGGFVVPEDLFTPDGPVLDLAALRAEIEQSDLRDQLWGGFAGDRPYFGVYGKLGERKGSFALLAAMDRLKRAGRGVGLVALAHGRPLIERRFRERARALGLKDSILQLPFLPHWRVPEFLRGCLAVCCLEQDFPIAFHSPIIPREVLLAGACLVGATEVMRKLPGHEVLAHGYSCIAVEDVNDVERLADQLAGLADDPVRAAAIGARGRDFARALQRDAVFPEALERILIAAAQRSPPGTAGQECAAEMPGSPDRFRFARIAARLLGHENGSIPSGCASGSAAQSSDAERARAVLAAIERRIGEGRDELRSLAAAIRLEIAVEAAERDDDGAAVPVERCDPLFRLRSGQKTLSTEACAGLVPVRDPRVRLVAFDYDATELLSAQTVEGLPASPSPRETFIAVFRRSDAEGRNPLVIDGETARILELCDGRKTAVEIAVALGDAEGPAFARRVAWIRHLFVVGLVGLRDASA